MNPRWAWGLAVLAVAAGWWSGGWAGVALAGTVIVFWLLLQWGQALRALREAAANPLGQVPNAVMLHSRLRAGLTLIQVLRLSRSLGNALPGEAASAEPGLERFEWADAGGDRVQLTLRNGRLVAWELLRDAKDAPDAPATPEAHPT